MSTFFKAIAIQHKSGAWVYPVMREHEGQGAVTLNGQPETDPSQIVRLIISGDVSVRCSNEQGDVSANLTLGKPAAPVYRLDEAYHHLVSGDDVKPSNLSAPAELGNHPALDTALPKLDGNELDPYLTRSNFALAGIAVGLVVLWVLL